MATMPSLALRAGAFSLTGRHPVSTKRDAFCGRVLMVFGEDDHVVVPRTPPWPGSYKRGEPLPQIEVRVSSRVSN